MKKTKHLLLVLLLVSTAALAYGPTGHRTVASIAQDELSHCARKKIAKLLGTNGMIYYSTWADEVRSDAAYNYSSPWHYQNLNENMSPESIEYLWENPTSEGEHLFYAIQEMMDRLKKNKKDVEALRFLIHFTGDLYQPMHLGRKEDRGGNQVGFTWFGTQTNIHSLWDGYLIDHHKMSFTELTTYLKDRYSGEKKSLKKNSLTDDLKSSYLICRRIYSYDNTDRNNYLYFYRFGDDLNLQLYKAGLRLAQFLESIY